MKILIIEDNLVLVKTLKDVLETNHYEVDYVTDLEQIKDYAILNNYNLIILDLMLGKYDGLDFLKMVREEINVPIIILTAKDTKKDIIKGFHLGASDYITKPFDMDILLARIQARIKNTNTQINYKNTQFDFDRLLVKADDKTVELTASEREILLYLLKNKGIFRTKADILMNTSHSPSSTERVIVSHIYNIRQKLLTIGAEDPIESRWKVGYRWKEN